MVLDSWAAEAFSLHTIQSSAQLEGASRTIQNKGASHLVLSAFLWFCHEPISDTHIRGRLEVT